MANASPVNNTVLLIAFGLYTLGIIAVGVYSARFARRSDEDFFLAGRSLGPWVAALSASASSESGWVLVRGAIRERLKCYLVGGADPIHRGISEPVIKPTRWFVGSFFPIQPKGGRIFGRQFTTAPKRRGVWAFGPVAQASARCVAAD